MAWRGATPVFLTSEADLVHPLAVLVPDQAWLEATTAPLAMDETGRLSLGPHHWARGPDLPPPDRPPPAPAGVLSANARLIRRCLPLTIPLAPTATPAATHPPPLRGTPAQDRLAEPPAPPPSATHPLGGNAGTMAGPSPAANATRGNPGHAKGPVQRTIPAPESSEPPAESGQATSSLLEAFLGTATNEFTAPLNDLRQALHHPGQPPEAPDRVPPQESLVGLTPFADWFGRGSGSTPSWDDLITGILLVDRWLGAPPRVHLGEPLLAAIRPRTTPVAWWQLAMADHGRANLRWESFLHALCTRPLSSAAILAAARQGHASGAEMLAGMLLRLESQPAQSSPNGPDGRSASAVPVAPRKMRRSRAAITSTGATSTTNE